METPITNSSSPASQSTEDEIKGPIVPLYNLRLRVFDNTPQQCTGPRVFQCIVDGCNERFKRCEALERHVNRHFLNELSSTLPSVCSDSNSQLNGKDHMHNSTKMKMKNSKRFNFADLLESSTIIRNKLIKRKKSKPKKKYLSVKTNEDYFDESIMELINFRLAEISMITGLDFFDNQSDVLFLSKVIGKCCPDKDGTSKVLIRWEPEGIIPDEWVSESDLSEMSSRRVPLKSLPIDSLSKILEKSNEKSSRGRKYRRE